MSATDVRTGQLDNLSYEDYFNLPEMNLRYDIVDGRLILLPSPELRHQLRLLELLRILDDHIRPRHLGVAVPAPFDVLIRREPRLQCRQPDILFVSFGRLGVSSRDELEDRKILPLEVPPELVVEIHSEDNRPSAVREKLVDYAFVGVDEVWILNRENRTVEVLFREGAQYPNREMYSEFDEIRSHVLPELKLRVSRIFQ